MKTCAAALLGVCLFLAGCWEQQVVYQDEREAFRQLHWVRSMTDEIESALRRTGEKGDVVVCMDTSGAVSDFDLNFFLDHIRAIAKEQSRELYLLIGAAEVVWEGRYAGPETLAAGSRAGPAAVWQGRGGADFRGLLQRSGELDPALIVYLADDHGILPAEKPAAAVVWILNQPCWTGPKGESYDPNCHDLEDFGTVISMQDSTEHAL